MPNIKMNSRFGPRVNPLDKRKDVMWFDQALHSTLTIVAVILFVLCLSLIFVGVMELIRGWSVLLGAVDVFEEPASSVFIAGLGMIVIGIAVLDLTKSILDEDITDQKIKNVQERARDFLTRFLPVIIFAISAEIFVKLAQSDISLESSIFSDIAMIGIAVGSMLVGLAIYMRMTVPSKTIVEEYIEEAERDLGENPEPEDFDAPTKKKKRKVQQKEIQKTKKKLGTRNRL